MLKIRRAAGRLALSGFLVAAAPLVLVAGTAPTLDGGEVVRRARQVALTTNFRAEFRLDVTTPTWSARRAGWIYKRLNDGVTDTLIVFQRPPAAEGLKILVQRPLQGTIQQWVCLPGARTRRLPSSEAGNALFGTEFDTRDLEMPASLSRAAIERKERYEGADAYVVAMTVSTNGDAPHEELVWIRAGDFVLLRREFYLDGELNRVYRVDRFEAVGGLATPVAMTVTNLAAKTLSRVRLRHVDYGTDFEQGFFALARLGEHVQAPR